MERDRPALRARGPGPILGCWAAIGWTLAAVAGCSGGKYEVVVRFEPESLASTVDRVEVTLIPDCGSQLLGEGPLSALSQVEIDRRSGSGSLPPAPAGTYGLYVRGWIGCNVAAAGCDEVTLEAGGSGRLVAVARTLAGHGCDPGSACMGDRCVRLDAGPLPDGSMPDGGSPDGGPDAGPPCSGDPPACDGDTLLTCEGGFFVRTVCALGCIDAPAACARLLPSNVGDRVGLDEGTADVIVGTGGSETVVFDTDDGSVTAWPGAPGMGTPTVLRAAGAPRESGGIVFEALSQSTGPELAVFAVGSLDVRRGATAAGVGTRPLVLLVATEVDISGTLTVAATSSDPGPGGFPGGAAESDPSAPGMGPGGGRPGRNGTGTDDSGGAGGSFGSRGGRGGDAPTITGGDSRPTYGDPTLQPLVGGSGGAGGGPPTAGGGNGGGAVQISAGGQIRVAPDGMIDACGSGGPAGPYAMAATGGGGGGAGSGGAILLEAPTVMLQGAIGANGGSGGQGAVGMMLPGTDGAAGSPTDVPAPGSPTSMLGGGGGDGSDAAGDAADGLPAEEGGGGGGGAGRIRINTAAGAEGFADGVTPTVASGLATVGTAARM